MKAILVGLREVVKMDDNNAKLKPVDIKFLR